jgi:hypothetical protein
MKEFKDKYNFDINEQEYKKQNLIRQYNPFRVYQYCIRILANDSLCVIKNTNLDGLERKKLDLESKTYHENLRAKIKLNMRLFSILFNNFYKDDFNQSRRGLYIMFSIPLLVGMGFYILSPRHPIRGLAFNVSLLSAFLFFGFSVGGDFENLAYSNTALGEEVRLLITHY